MSAKFDLDAYIERIQYSGSCDPTLESLTKILFAHTATIPFENIDVLLGREIKIDMGSVQDKLVTSRRGGYCFEHGTLFVGALSTLGFDVSLHAAKVTLLVPRSEAPRTHMFMSVKLPEGQFVVDPGFGGFAPRFPVPIPGKSAADLLARPATHRIRLCDRFYTLEIDDGNRTIDAWSSTLELENRVDFILGNHYTSTHPNSQFVERLMMRAFSGDSIVSIMNKDVTVRRNGSLTTSKLADRRQLRALIAKDFGFDLPEVETLRVPTIPEWR